MDSVDHEVVIVGAGPVGLVTALRLAQSGIATRVIEAGQTIDDSPRAIVYHSHTVGALDDLGLLPDLLNLGVVKHNTEWRAVDGRLLGNLDLALLGPDDTPYPYHLHVGQHVLAGVALDHLLRFPNARVDWGHKLVGIAQTDDVATLDVETASGREAIRAPWVVGADGASSTARRALGLGFDGQTWPEWFVATDIPYDFEACGWAKTTFIVDPVHWAVIVQIAEGLYRVTYGEPGDVPREDLRARARAKYRVLLPGPTDVEPLKFSPYRVHDRCAERFRVGRVLLAGDAAHAVNPIGGLGLTNGILDALAVADALAATLQDRAPAAVLDRYAEERQRIFRDIVSPAARENKRWISESDPARRAADAERFASFTGNRGIARNAMLFTEKLVSPPFAA